MAREKILRVVPRLPRDVRPVALETCRAHMARLARPRPRARFCSVPFPELPRMPRRWDTRPTNVHGEARGSAWHCSNGSWNYSDMAARAALPRMTACTCHRPRVRLGAVSFPKLLRVTRWSAPGQERPSRASRTCSRHCRDGARRHTDVTARAALARVARRTRRGSALRVSSM